jgi:hypothetical protein
MAPLASRSYIPVGRPSIAEGWSNGLPGHTSLSELAQVPWITIHEQKMSVFCNGDFIDSLETTYYLLSLEGKFLVKRFVASL